MNNLLMRAKDLETGYKVWKDLRKLLDQLILKSEMNFE